MSTLPSPPFIPIEGISNFRDIGNLPTPNASKTRPGLVFRSADPCKATPTGLKHMSEQLGIQKIFDLRSAPEIRRDGPEWAGVDTISSPSQVFSPYSITHSWVPVFAEKDYGPEQVALRYKEYTRSGTEGFVRAYHDILLSGSAAYAKIFAHLSSEDPAPCLINCTAGKDRTGVAVALILSIAGVERERIAEEYALTDLGLKDLKPVFVERLLKNPVLEGNREGVESMVSSRKEVMVAALEMIGREFGGAEKYMRERCGLSDEGLEKMRRNLVVGV